MSETSPVVAHTDWSARNVRLRPGGPVAVYDMDSLAVVGRATALGVAAVTWRALGVAGEPVGPDIDEVDDWLDRYPDALGPIERRASLAAALRTLCYVARCEHAIDPSERTHAMARERLRIDAARYRRALDH